MQEILAVQTSQSATPTPLIYKSISTPLPPNELQDLWNDDLYKSLPREKWQIESASNQIYDKYVGEYFK